MNNKKILAVLLLITAFCKQPFAQEVQISKEELVSLTPEWKGERFPDGRPKVPDKILERMRSVSVEEA